MPDWNGKRVLVIGLGASGRAACHLLLRLKARVSACDEAEGAELKEVAEDLGGRGVEVVLGAKALPGENYDLVVSSPGVPAASLLLQEATRRGLRVIGELELGYEEALCLCLAISGTNGKTTLTEMVVAMLGYHGLRTAAAGNNGVPLTGLVERTRELDFLTLEVSVCQLERTEYFRPVLAVMLNLSPDHLDRYPRMADYIRTKARLFLNQQPFDWAIVQSEALAQMRAMDVKIPSKIITFSASNRRADIYLSRGLLLSRLEGWQGPLLDLDQCALRGPHNAENLMAALAVGRVLRIPLETMVGALEGFSPPAFRCELVRTVDGVSYINDAKSSNLDALRNALLSVPPRAGGEQNIWLIAGGKDKGLDYHDIGPLLSQRVKRAYVFGETQAKMRAAWSLFTPCTLVGSLLEAIELCAGAATAGDVVLFSPACSSFDQFRNYRHRGEVFDQAVRALTPRPKPGGRSWEERTGRGRSADGIG